MKTVIIHGQSHKGSTYHIAHELAEKIGGEMTEFFLPRDFGEFCTGCAKCFNEGESACPHYDKLSRITDAMDSADVIILASPVYVYHASGSMKAFLDHFGYRWMVHRPNESMFAKQGVCISTAAGAGMKSANKDMADSLFFWGVPKIYKYGVRTLASCWDHVSKRKKNAIDKETTKLSEIITERYGKVKPGLKTRSWFRIVRSLRKKGSDELDSVYWKEKGWIGRKRPWKKAGEKGQ